MIQKIERRAVLKAAGLTASSLTLFSPMAALLAKTGNDATATGSHDLGVFVSIANSGDVTIVNHRAEMGQGIFTSVPQIIADELEASWAKVSVVQAQGDAKYGNQGTGGSASIRSHFAHIRQMGATARVLLEQAAAKTWGVPITEVAASNHAVTHSASGRSLGFGALAEKAAQYSLPDPATIPMKKISDFKLVGRDVALAGQEAIIRGEAQYAHDMHLPNMVIASIERPPVVGARVKNVDASAAKKMPGVIDVITLQDRPFPVRVKPVSGVAVIATNTWVAQEARKKLKITWDNTGPITRDNAKHQSDTYLKNLVKLVSQKGIQTRKEGDVYGHTYDANNTLEATYTVPYHHHMCMETPAATAWVKKTADKIQSCEVWTGTQNPQWAKGLISEELGIPGDNITVNMTLMGGAFGRKGKNDYTLEAVELSRKLGKPVKVIWTREDDVKHGFYHSISANYIKAELTPKGGADYWLQRVAYPPIGANFHIDTKTPDAMALSLGFADIPFALEHLQAETHEVDTHVRIGWFRAVANINNAFALGSFVDELAAKVGVSTHVMWHRLIGEDRIVNPAKEGFPDWTNYGQQSEAYDLNTRRMKGVIDHIVKHSGADKPTAKNEAWGISYGHSFNSYVAAATKVRVNNNQVTLLEMHTAIDCGIAVTPDRVKSQMEGAMIMGASTALQGEITLKEGAVEQGNFHDYPTVRIHQIPPLFVHIVASSEAPGGVGEPGMPPVLPSITNAIFHASGKRIRDLPINKHLTI